MVGKERKTWLRQINRIHREQILAREHEFKKQINQLMTMKSREQES
jgi:hypothetical protein